MIIKKITKIKDECDDLPNFNTLQRTATDCNALHIITKQFSAHEKVKEECDDLSHCNTL